MSYPSASTTTILPVSGALNLTSIAALSGIKGSLPNIGAASKPYRLSEFKGQDFDIPSGSNPIRYSNFRGAISYNYNYLLYLNSGLTTGVQDTDLFYYSNSSIVQAPYKAKSLGNISRLLDIQTKGASTYTTDTFALKSAVIQAHWEGLMAHDVSLWMQINNSTYNHVSKAISAKKFKLNVKTVNSFISNVQDGLDITIAPEIVKDLKSLYVINPFTKTTSDNFYFANNADSIVAKLSNYLNSLQGSKAYTVNLKDVNIKKNSIELSILTYIPSTVPLCYLVGYAQEHKGGTHWAEKSVTINLAKYPIQLGSTIKFYMGPGPGTPDNGSKWGVKGSMTLSLNIINTPLITVT